MGRVSSSSTPIQSSSPRGPSSSSGSHQSICVRLPGRAIPPSVACLLPGITPERPQRPEHPVRIGSRRSPSSEPRRVRVRDIVYVQQIDYLSRTPNTRPDTYVFVSTVGEAVRIQVSRCIPNTEPVGAYSMSIIRLPVPA